MRIAFLNRGRETHPGGDLVALDATMAALKKRGVECVETGWHSEKIKEFDLAHIWHCNFDWSWGNYQAVVKAGKKYVMTTMYYPDLLAGITSKQLMEMTGESSALLPFSRIESGYMIHPRVRMIPCGTSDIFHSHYPERRGVMCVSARGKSDKGVEMVEAICKRLKMSFIFPEGLSQSALATAYAGAKVFVNASGSERMSLTIGEALCAGCRVLATQENWGNEWYPGIVTFDPHNEIQLEHLIRWAIYAKDWDYRPNEAAREITWDWVAEKIHGVYQEVLA